MKNLQDVYIQGGLRSPIGLMNGQFKDTRPEYLGAAVIDALLERYRPEFIDQVLCGNAVGTGGNIGRLMTLLSTLPKSVPAITLDMQCASAGAAFNFGYSSIASGLCKHVIVGGIESSSLQPLRTYDEKDTR